MHGATIDVIRINGGRLCLDFINTAGYEAGQPLLEFIGRFEDLVTWGLREALIDEATATNLRTQASADPDAAALARGRALDLRGALREIFEPDRPAAERNRGLAELNHTLARDAADLSLQVSTGGARYAHPPGLRLWLTGPVAISAAALATSADVSRVRMCPGEGCHWLFLDLSRNGTRRWCSMASCGNRAKVRAHHARLNRFGG